MLTLEALKGRVFDLDSHEMAPFANIKDLFGERGVNMLNASPNFRDPLVYNQNLPIPPGHKDTIEITPKSVWESKGGGAPGALDFNRRPAVLDAMGIRRQLVFPGMATVAMIQAQGGLLNTTSEHERAEGWAAIDAHNEWAASVTNSFPDRLRVVGIVAATKPGATPEAITKQAQQQIASGIRAIMIDSALPPGGVSPGNPVLDPFYATLAEANVPLIIHPPSGLGYVDPAWVRADFMLGFHQTGQAAENFIRLLVMGGVFERHPTLRFAAIELGSAWFGPMAEWLDVQILGNVAEGFGRQDIKLPMKPSEYLARNVRVTPYNFEPVERWIERYPNLQDCYCFSTDYPHVEGRPWALNEFFGQVSPLGDKIVEKFFCSNAELILP